MPGKQMAVDADLNTGVISEQDAKKRRSDIQREADFYGAMDGASKFIKGDAIISIIIHCYQYSRRPYNRPDYGAYSSKKGY